MKYLLLITAILFPFGSIADDLLKEPPLKLKVTVGGKEVAVTPGEETKVEGTFNDPVIKVETGEYRTFSHAGISFDYAAGCNWEAIKDDEGYTWTIEGPEVTVIVLMMNEDLEAKDIADALGEPEDRKARITACRETHGGREFKGSKVSCEFSGIPMVIRIFKLPHKNGSMFIQLLDSSDDNAKGGAEFRQAMERLGKSLRLESE